MARLLADHFGALAPLMEATAEDLQQIHGIGPEVAESLAHFFAGKRNRKVLDRLLASGVKPVHEARVKGPQPLAGQVVVFTGGLESLTRPEAQKRAEDGRRAHRLGHLEARDPGGRRPRRRRQARRGAQAQELEIIDEAEFLKRVGGK